MPLTKDKLKKGWTFFWTTVGAIFLLCIAAGCVWLAVAVSFAMPDNVPENLPDPASMEKISVGEPCDNDSRVDAEIDDDTVNVTTTGYHGWAEFVFNGDQRNAYSGDTVTYDYNPEGINMLRVRLNIYNPEGVTDHTTFECSVAFV